VTFILYPKRKCAKTIVTGVVYPDMLEEFLMVTLEACGPNVMLFNKTAVDASVFSHFKFSI
jgi:hypothetical protein